jgi:hypothetical protein
MAPPESSGLETMKVSAARWFPLLIWNTAHGQFDTIHLRVP